ncbi:MAG: branched-chain amino acid ABC transporter permease [Dethiobacter sp.]|jgi:branched-chain amino acid transport system permease protein|nr:MAG: branched-chain amino acid ABC transporter permease [Dethiobacter sp.]
MELVIYGIINSVSLILMSIGFALAYGVSRVPNFAHGALFILTGYITWIFLYQAGLPYALAVILSLIIIALIGAALYQLILIRVRGMPISEIIASFGVGLAILELLRWAGLRGMTYMLPPFMKESLNIAGVPVSYHRVIIVGAAMIMLFFLWYFTHYTKPGLALRAIAQNERAALVLGIDSDRAATVAVSLGAVLAGLAGVLLLPLGNIVVEMGYEVLVFAIAVSVCGGLGSWKGAVVASFLIGFAQIITVTYLASHYHFVVALLIIIIVLITKPSGLYGRQKELEERV